MHNTTTLRPLLAFYSDLHQIAVEDNAVALGAKVFTETTHKALSADHRPLLLVYPPIIHTESFIQITNQVACYLKKHFPGLTEQVDRILSAIPTAPTQQEEFIAKIFIPGTDLTTCFDEDLHTETLNLLFSHAIKPFMRQYIAKALPESVLESWFQGTCPVCGDKPTLAVLEKDDQGKSLYCGTCEVKWRFHRLNCPFCYSNNSQYILIEGEEKYRIYVCDQCKGYLKTIVAEYCENETLNPFIEELSTLHLDLMAVNEGYHQL